MKKQPKHIQKFLQEYAPSKEMVGKQVSGGKCLLVVSSTSGFGNASKLAPQVVDYLKPGFSTISIIPTQHAGHAYEILNKEPSLTSYKVVVILGGDGAFSEAVNGMLLREDEQMVTLAHCPGGSGCATSGNAMGCWKGEDIEQACKIITEGKVQSMDVIEVTRDGFEAPIYSILNVAGGLYTDVVDLADKHYKWTYNIFGPTARYAFGLIRALRTYGQRDNHRLIRYTFNDEPESIVLPTLGYALYNNGRPMEHARYASCRFDDGTMSLSLSQKYLGLVKHLKYAGDLAKENELRDEAKDNHFIRDGIVSMKVEPVDPTNNGSSALPPRPLKTMLDGEKDRVTHDYMDAPFTAKILPGKITIIVA